MKDITLENIVKTYDGQKVLNGLCAVFPAGSRTCIMGPSGCGKTTLLRLILGLEAPDSGILTGTDQPMACVFQEDRLLPFLTAEDNVFALLPEKRGIKTARAALLRLGLTQDDLCKPISEYSGGMKRRAALVRAVEANRGILVLDEPFKGLDTRQKSVAASYITETLSGATILCATHDRDDAALLNAEILDIPR